MLTGAGLRVVALIVGPCRRPIRIPAVGNHAASHVRLEAQLFFPVPARKEEEKRGVSMVDDTIIIVFCHTHGRGMTAVAGAGAATATAVVGTVRRPQARNNARPSIWIKTARRENDRGCQANLNTSVCSVKSTRGPVPASDSPLKRDLEESSDPLLERDEVDAVLGPLRPARLDDLSEELVRACVCMHACVCVCVCVCE